MPTPDYIVLVLTVMAGLAMAGGATVLTLSTPKYAAARAAFCIAAICIILAGVIWGVTAEHSSMLARYLGAGLTAAVAAMGLVWILTHLHETKPEASLFLECSTGVLPRIFPPSGRFYVTEILPIQFDNNERVSLGLGYHFGSPGAVASPPELVRGSSPSPTTDFDFALAPVAADSAPDHHFRPVLEFHEPASTFSDDPFLTIDINNLASVERRRPKL